jgi:hypothetical protein
LFGELQSGGRIDVSVIDNDLNFAIGPVLTKEQRKALKRGIPLEEVQGIQEDAEKQDN